MFPTRSLFGHLDCPDIECNRSSCLFAHRAARGKQEEDGEEKVNQPTKLLKRKATSTTIEGDGSNKRRTDAELKTLLAALKSGPRNAYVAKREQGSSLPISISQKAETSTSTLAIPKTATVKPVVEAKPTNTISDTIQAPTIARTSHPGASPVPFSSRQTSLRTFFTSFEQLYSSLVPRAPEANPQTGKLIKRIAHHLASQDALSSENKIFKNSNVNFLAYKNSIRTGLVGLGKRQKVDKEAEEQGKKECICMLGIQIAQMAGQTEVQMVKAGTSPEEKKAKVEALIKEMLQESILIGTFEEVEKKKKAHEERIKGRLDVERLQSANLLPAREVLQSVGYPIPDLEKGNGDLQVAIEESWGPGGRQVDLEGTSLVCDRCSTPFVVTNLDSDDAKSLREACSYHWAKKRFVREANVGKGPRLPRWQCCDALDEATMYASDSLSQVAVSAGLVSSNQAQVITPSGCTIGPHVFKEESCELLHQREAFMSTEEVCKQADKSSNQKEKHEVLAFDCELVYTTAGMSLARLTVLDESGKVIMDQHVKPKASVVDYNTRFSGIKAEDLQASDKVVDLSKAREMMAGFMTPSTILVGHGLENDLKALRLIHVNVADSALIYKHHKGLPFRISLRELTLKHLGKQIQTGDATFGHDPEEDARAALDLVRRQYLEVSNRSTLLPSSAQDKNVSVAPQEAQQSQQSFPNMARANPSANASANNTTTPTNKTTPTTTTTSGPSEAAKASLFIKKRAQKKRAS